MIYVFEDFELDTAKVELRQKGEPIAVEPQVFAMLSLLIENRERLVTKDELVEKIWNGRFISDAAIASRVKSARQALGDDGREQRFIKTHHGQGFRFVADVNSRALISVQDVCVEVAETNAEAQRPSIAVMPFRLVGVAGPAGAIADALPFDLITELSRLRWLFVIARGSSFRFRGADADIDKVRAALNVRYCLSGVVEIHDRDMTVSVELADTQDRHIVWSDRYRSTVGAVHEIREEISRAVVTSLELQIPLNEARRARLQAPNQLDAWSMFHLGTQHMYRFNKADNRIATDYFKRAVELEPGFARAYAGLSWTHFQDAFLAYTGDVENAAKLARAYAEQCLERDPLEPFGNFTMGRSHWLNGDIEASVPWLERANQLNPNFAQGRYASAFVDGIAGKGAHGVQNSDMALALSPLDPMLYAMLSARAFGHLAQGEYGLAAEWVERGARAPRAHELVEMCAVATHALNGDDARARAWAESARARAPHASQSLFFRAFPFRDPGLRTGISRALAKHGFDSEK